MIIKHGIKTYVAEQIGKSSSYVGMFFRGTRDCSWQTANRFAALFPETDPADWMNSGKKYRQTKLQELNDKLNMS